MVIARDTCVEEYVCSSPAETKICKAGENMLFALVWFARVHIRRQLRHSKNDKNYIYLSCMHSLLVVDSSVIGFASTFIAYILYILQVYALFICKSRQGILHTRPTPLGSRENRIADILSLHGADVNDPCLTNVCRMFSLLAQPNEAYMYKCV